jgi:hypothetical protein
VGLVCAHVALSIDGSSDRDSRPIDAVSSFRYALRLDRRRFDQRVTDRWPASNDCRLQSALRAIPGISP